MYVLYNISFINTAAYPLARYSLLLPKELCAVADLTQQWLQ